MIRSNRGKEEKLGASMKKSAALVKQD